MMDTLLSIDLIASNPKVRNGRPYILGTTITVIDVAIAHVYHQQNASGIMEWFGLEAAQVYAALAYYYAHKDDLDVQIQSRIEHAEALEANQVGRTRSILP